MESKKVFRAEWKDEAGITVCAIKIEMEKFRGVQPDRLRLRVTRIKIEYVEPAAMLQFHGKVEPEVCVKLPFYSMDYKTLYRWIWLERQKHKRRFKFEKLSTLQWAIDTERNLYGC